MTSIRRAKKEDIKIGKTKLPTKEQKIKRSIKKTTAQHQSLIGKQLRKDVNNEAFQAEREKAFNNWIPDDPQDIKEQLYKNRLSRIADIASGKIVKDPKTPKKYAKGETAPLHDTTNGLAFRFKGNQNRSQTYLIKHLTDGYRLLQTNILGVPSLSLNNTDHVEKLRTAADMEDINKRKYHFNNALKDLIVKDNKTDSLSLEITIAPNYTIKKVEVGAYMQVIDHNFRKKDLIEKFIASPINDESFEQFNYITDFCNGKMGMYKKEKDFIDYLNNQEVVPKRQEANKPFTSTEMKDVLTTLGFETPPEKDMTVGEFILIQELDLKMEDKDIIPAYHPAYLSADYMVKVLRCATNEGMTHFFATTAKDIPHFEYEVNPKTKKPLKDELIKSIAPITDPVKDPRSTLNAAILRHFIDSKEALFTEDQMSNLREIGIENHYKWELTAHPSSKEKDMPKHLKIVA